MRLYTLDERLVLIDEGVLDLGGELLDARLYLIGAGGSGFCWSSGGVRPTKTWKEGTFCSIPSSGEEEEPALASDGLLKVPAGCNFDILRS